MANKKLAATIVIGGAIAGSLRTAVGGTKKALGEIGKSVRDLTKKQKALGAEIKKMGAASRDVSGLRNEYSRLTGQLDRARMAQQRLNSAAERSAKFRATGHRLMGMGGKAAVGAVAIGAAYMPGIKESKRYQTEQNRLTALGMGAATNRQAMQFAHTMRTYGTSQTENLTLVRDALSIFGDLHHAKMVAPTLARMKFGNAAVYGAEQGAENESKFMDMLKVIELRGGTKSKSAFDMQANMIQRVISATGGRVGADEWRHAISTGGLAAKSMRNDAFYYQLEPLVQEMGGDRVGTSLMSGYSALYQGRTTKRAVENLQKLGLIGDSSKIKNDKSGQIAHLDVGAIKGAQLFRQSQYEWMKQVLLPTLAKKGLTSKDQVLDAIGSIFSSRKGADLMAAMYLQQQQIDKSERVNRGAADIDTIDKTGRGMTAGKEIAAEKKLADLKLRMGNDILPLYTSALETAATALEKLNDWTDKSPALSKAMVVGIGAIGVALGVLAPVLIVGSTALSAYAKWQTMVATRAATATVAIGEETAAMDAQALSAGKLGGIFGILGKAAKGLVIGELVWQGLRAAGVPGEDQAKGVAEFNSGHKFKAMFHMSNGYLQALATGHAGKAPPALPPAPAPKGDWGEATVHATFNITQQPGENSKALADRVAGKLSGWPRATGGSSLYDQPRGY